ncbi:MAG: chemotaxis protein CheX [Spirochaetaceae bacterium]|jgi:chemotaxis protein CheX|nr:chemotaxis protein CheX [Spirochaetaceae bacterium]
MVFKRFVGADIKAERPYYADAGEKEAGGWDLFGIIGFSGDVRGALVISMKKGLAFKLTAALTSRIYTELEADVLDAVGELVNIIAGHIKKGIDSGLRLIISLPITVRGYNHAITWLTGHTKIICIPFKIFDGDGFMVSITLEMQDPL